MAEAPSARFRAQILDAFSAHAARLGWTDAAFEAAAKDARLSAGEAALACPRGAADLFDAFAARADQKMLAAHHTTRARPIASAAMPTKGG